MPTNKTRSRAPKVTASESEGAEQTEVRAPSRIAESNVPDSIAGWMAAAERCAREEPLKCAGVVVAVGVVGSILPLGRLIGSLVRPVLMIAGVVKVFEEVERRRNS